MNSRAPYPYPQQGKLLILGAGESGVGAAILGQQKGFEVLVSDAGMIAEKYKEELRSLNLAFEEGGIPMRHWPEPIWSSKVRESRRPLRWCCA